MSAIFQQANAFSGFSVDDIAAAKRFYGETLGLAVEVQDNGLLSLHIAGGHDTIVYPKPNHQPATFTILNFPPTSRPPSMSSSRAASAASATTAWGRTRRGSRATPAARRSPGSRIPRGTSSRCWSWVEG
jgi:catechol 2,3-dioxygenase-like lactoylglutathione lyase family enzyme